MGYLPSQASIENKTCLMVKALPTERPAPSDIALQWGPSKGRQPDRGEHHTLILAYISHKPLAVGTAKKRPVHQHLHRCHSRCNPTAFVPSPDFTSTCDEGFCDGPAVSVVPRREDELRLARFRGLGLDPETHPSSTIIYVFSPFLFLDIYRP
jgi:hypothetical protein